MGVEETCVRLKNTRDKRIRVVIIILFILFFFEIGFLIINLFTDESVSATSVYTTTNITPDEHQLIIDEYTFGKSPYNDSYSIDTRAYFIFDLTGMYYEEVWWNPLRANIKIEFVMPNYNEAMHLQMYQCTPFNPDALSYNNRPSVKVYGYMTTRVIQKTIEAREPWHPGNILTTQSIEMSLEEYQIESGLVYFAVECIGGMVMVTGNAEWTQISINQLFGFDENILTIIQTAALVTVTVTILYTFIKNSKENQLYYITCY